MKKKKENNILPIILGGGILLLLLNKKQIFIDENEKKYIIAKLSYKRVYNNSNWLKDAYFVLDNKRIYHMTNYSLNENVLNDLYKAIENKISGNIDYIVIDTYLNDLQFDMAMDLYNRYKNDNNVILELDI